MPVRIAAGAWSIVKEIARHVLRRPVVGVAAAAHSGDGRWLLIRRADTGDWALPGGTLEWNETLRAALARELLEEAGVEPLDDAKLCGVYSDPSRDFRFHAVTVVVRVRVGEPRRAPLNPLEVREVGWFKDTELPEQFSHGMRDMLDNARHNRCFLE